MTIKMGLIILTLDHVLSTYLMVVLQFPAIRLTIHFHFSCVHHRLNFASVVLIIEQLVCMLTTLRPMGCKSTQSIQQIYKLDPVFDMCLQQELMHDPMNK